MSKLWSNDTLQQTTSVIGSITLLYTTYSTVKFLWGWVRPSRLHLYRTSKDKNWAVVTGASDGIGLAFVKTLLSRDFDVLLHGRNKVKLENLRTELSSEFPKRGVEIVVADASKPDDSYMNVAEKARSLPGTVSILVNNVGGIPTTVQYNHHGDVPHEDIDVVLNLNVRFGTHLTREMLPILRASPRALIVNLGSVGGIMGVPYIATYCGTKGYVHAFNDALRTEMVAMGIDNVDVNAFIVGNTSSSTNTHAMPFTSTSLQCAASCLDKAGANDESLLWAHWMHVPPGWVMSALPRGMMRRIMSTEVQKRYDSERKAT